MEANRKYRRHDALNMKLGWKDVVLVLFLSVLLTCIAVAVGIRT
jgi:heme/copper-type cytochrome/quinol oxidase subunit 4